MQGFVTQIIDYVITGQCFGSFRYALMTGSLYEAVKQADSMNKIRLTDLVEWVISHCPVGCWGSVEKVQEWSSKGGLMGLGGQEAVDQWKAINDVEI